MYYSLSFSGAGNSTSLFFIFIFIYFFLLWEGEREREREKEMTKDSFGGRGGYLLILINHTFSHKEEFWKQKYMKLPRRQYAKYGTAHSFREVDVLNTALLAAFETLIC